MPTRWGEARRRRIVLRSSSLRSLTPKTRRQLSFHYGQRSFFAPHGVNSGESLGFGCRSSGKTARVCAAVTAIDRFSAFGTTAQPAHSMVNSATTVSLNVLRFSMVFFMKQRAGASRFLCCACEAFCPAAVEVVLATSLEMEKW